MATVVCLAPLLFGSACRGDQLQDLAQRAGIVVLSAGDSSADAQKKTAASLPLHQLTPENQQRAGNILNRCSQYRKLPSLQYTVDEPMYRYLVQHPDVAVSTWRVMGISRFEMLQTGPQEYEAAAVDGTEGIADILYQDTEQILFICEGNYHNVLLPKPLEASALIWFRAQCFPHTDGTHLVAQKADVFVRFPSLSVAAVAKMLAPVTNNLMDRNLFEVSLYGSMMSRAVRDEPEWIVQMAQEMEGVLPQRREELINLARLSRRTDGVSGSRPVTALQADRAMILSPHLLFLDPPKAGADSALSPEKPQPPTTDNAGQTAQEPLAKPGSPIPTIIVPAARGSRKATPGEAASELTGQAATSTAPSVRLQPAVTPAGPTATGPVGNVPAGRVSTTSVNR